MSICKKCGVSFTPVKGLISYCSLSCRNSRIWSQQDKAKRSISGLNSTLVKSAAKVTAFKNALNAKVVNICPVCHKDVITIKCKDKKYHHKCYLTTIGGIKLNSGRSKSGWYKGVWCGSSYELAWVIYNIDEGIEFSRNLEGFEYEKSGKLFKYYPDFITNEGYVEIKGYHTEVVDLKAKQFPHKLTILYKKDMEHIFNYVHNTYGKDFIRLYEGNPYRQKNNKCAVCDESCLNVYCSKRCSMKGNRLK